MKYMISNRIMWFLTLQTSQTFFAHQNTNKSENDHAAIFHKLEIKDVHEVTETIIIDDKFHVRLFHNGSGKEITVC